MHCASLPKPASADRLETSFPHKIPANLPLKTSAACKFGADSHTKLHTSLSFVAKLPSNLFWLVEISIGPSCIEWHDEKKIFFHTLNHEHGTREFCPANP